MNDTPPPIETRYREMLLARSGAERLRMGSGMLAMAVRMVEASLPASSEAERRAALFLRLYGRDFDDATRERLAARFRESDGRR